MAVESDECYVVGVPLTQLTAPLAINAYQACADDPRFTVLELRKIDGDNGAEVIIVECKNDAVASKNKLGIRYVEQLALVFSPDARLLPEVWALRRDFPATAHQNAVPPSMPAAFCLYFEPWATVARTWTGHKHLERIAVWLADTAAGTLHRADQPVEQFYFNSPTELVLPAGLKKEGLPSGQVLLVHAVQRDAGQNKMLLISELGDRATTSSGAKVSTAFVTVSPVISGSIERPARTLGELQDQLVLRGSDLVQPLADEIYRVAEGGIPASNTEMGLVVVRVPIQRTATSEVETFQVMGFLLDKGLGPVGQAMNLLAPPHNGKYIRATILGGDSGTAWRNLKIDGIAVIEGLDAARAQQLTGVTPATADFRGALIGAGSLGSQMGDIWAREAWGTWTLIDEDLVKPHNVPRHRGHYGMVGLNKATAVASMMNSCLQPSRARHTGLIHDATASSHEVRSSLANADLIVDVSTTLYVPRDLSRQDDLRRLASVFLTPSGNTAVLLLEDSARAIRLDALEAQYYRAIVRAPWGVNHLTGHLAEKLWVGAGCREATTVLAPDLISVHAGTLCRQLRCRRDQTDAHIGTWRYDDATGSLIGESTPAHQVIEEQRGDWRIVWDKGLKDSIHSLRSQRLPKETGGVLVGFIDHVLKSVYIVDALAATPDSIENGSSFERGFEGLATRVNEISEMTAGVVGYVGEWHSHPKGCSTTPSMDDVTQLAFLASHLRNDGAPALMLIVGDDHERLILGEAHALTSKTPRRA